MSNLIKHTVGNALIGQRVTDGYINATILCQACGKLVADYLRLGSTSEFLEELSRSMGIPIDHLVQKTMQGTNESRGTWVHPNVAIHLAQWCSARFAVLVSKWVYDWLTTGQKPGSPAQTGPQFRPWGERMQKTLQRHRRHVVENFEPGAFSTYTATATDILVIEDELYRHEMPLRAGDLPDGSIGLRYANMRRDNNWPAALGKAPLEMPHLAIKVVEVLVYSPDERSKFEAWLNFHYIPEFMPDYFNKKLNWKGLRLPAASAADHASLGLVGVHAKLAPGHRKALANAGGFVTARQLRPPEAT